MFSRMQDIQKGGLDDTGISINQVERSLDNIGIALRDGKDSFRDFQDVLEEVALKWDTLTEIQQADLKKTISGIRQAEIFTALMENRGMVMDLLAEQTNSAGYAMDRYAAYLDSAEAAQNRMTSSWEKLWMDFISGDAVKNLYNLGTALLDATNKIGGLSTILKIAIPLLILFNNQLIAQGLTNFAMGILNIGSSISKLNALLLANPIGVYIAAIVSLIAVWKELNKFVELNKKLIKDTSDAWNTSLESVERETKRATDVLKAYEGQVYAINKAYKDAPWYTKPFIDQQKIIDQGLKKTIESIAATADSYKEYKELSAEAAKAAGYVVDENGKLYKSFTDVDGTIVQYASTIQVGTEANYNLSQSVTKVTDEMEKFNQMRSVAQYENIRGALAGVTDQMKFFNSLTENLNTVTKQAANEGVYDLVSTFSKLKGEIDAVNDIIAKSMKGEFTYDDIEALKAVYGDYLDVLELEGGKLEVNTDKLREYNLEKARQELAAAQAAKATDKEIAIIQNYIDQLEAGISQSKEYIDNFQLMIGATSQSLGENGEAFNRLGGEITSLSQMFEDGEMDAATYFDALESRIKDMDFAAMFGENKEAAQTFFAGLTMNAAQSLSQISSMFAAGEMSVTDYADQLAQLSDVFGVIGNIAMNFGSSMGMSPEQLSGISAGFDQITNSANNLRQMQETNILVQGAWNESLAGGLQFGTEAYNQYMQKIAEAAAKSGQVFTDMSGKAMTSASDIYKYLTGATGNFQMFADQSANKTGQSIQQLVSAAGDMLIALGDAITNFDAQIDFTPTMLPGAPGAITVGPVSIPVSIPKFTYDITGSGSGLSGLGGALKGFGESLKSIPVQFDASIYTNPGSMNQATGEVNGLSGAYNDLTGAANAAGNAMSGASNAASSAADEYQKKLDKMIAKIKKAKEKEKQRLQDQLEAYRRIIEAKKKILEREKEEQDYLDSTGEKRRNIANLQAEIEELRLDDSEEAKAKLLLLEEELREAQLELDQDEKDRAYELQMQALDDELEAFTQGIEDRIKVIDRYLADTDRITKDAMKKLGKHGKDLYEQMSGYNRDYANSISNTITAAWQEAYNAVLAYNAAVGASGGSAGNVGGNKDTPKMYHRGGFVGNVRTNEEFAKLLKGEYVINQSSMDKFMSNILPRISNPEIGSRPSPSEPLNLGTLMNLTVEGNLDKSVLPDMERYMNMTLEKLVNILTARGYLRTSKSFSV